jgi:uncharacterized membrane protein YesL
MKPGKTKKRLFEGGLYAWMEKLFDAVALNFLWLLCSLPLVTAGAAVTAFYYATVKVIRGERGHILTEFWRSFRLNFVKATLIWMSFASLIFILLINRNIAIDIEGYFGIFLLCLYTVIVALFLGVLLYVFPVISRFYMTVPQVLKLSVYMCFRYLHYTLGLLTISASAVAVVYFQPLLVFCVPVGVLYCLSYLMEPLLTRHSPAEAEREGHWYLNLAGRRKK